MDVSALKHIAYVFDALIYYMKSGTDPPDVDVLRDGLPPSAWNDQVISVSVAHSIYLSLSLESHLFINYKQMFGWKDENENEEAEDDITVAMETESLDEQESSTLQVVMANSMTAVPVMIPPMSTSGKGRKHSFFQRSESTLCLGAPPPDPFESPMSEALPLADQPHLLQPNARREDLFGIPKQPITLPNSGSGSYNPLEMLPTRLGLSVRTADTAMTNPTGPTPTTLNIMGPSALPPVPPESEDSNSKSSGRPMMGYEPQPGTSKQRDFQSFESFLTSVKNESAQGELLSNYNEYINLYCILYSTYAIHVSVIDDSNGGGEERPQDLSCSKEGTSSRMDVDSDHEYNSDTDSTSNSRGAKVSPLPPISTVIPPNLLTSAGLGKCNYRSVLTKQLLLINYSSSRKVDWNL